MVLMVGEGSKGRVRPQANSAYYANYMLFTRVLKNSISFYFEYCSWLNRCTYVPVLYNLQIRSEAKLFI